MAPFKVSTALLALLMLMYASLANGTACNFGCEVHRTFRTISNASKYFARPFTAFYVATAALQFTQSTYTVSESGRFASIEIARGAGDVGQVTALLDVTEGSAVDGFDFRGLSKEPVHSAHPIICFFLYFSFAKTLNLLSSRFILPHIQVVLEADQDRVTVRVAIFDNFWSDGSRSANLMLTQPDGAITTATLLITDDEEAEVRSMHAAPAGR